MEPEFHKVGYPNDKLPQDKELTFRSNSYAANVRVSDETDRLPSNIHVAYWDILAILISISSHIVDVCLDLNLAYQYYLGGKIEYMKLTIIFISFPALVNTAVSIRMYTQEKSETSTGKIIRNYKISWIFILVLQLAPIIRYADSLTYALKSRKAEKRKDYASQRKFYELMLKEDSDVALLRVFECFLEAAPQQILQVAIVLAEKERGGTTFEIVHQAGSIISSLLSMAWSMASYHRSIRFAQENKQNMSWPATAIQFMWHFNVTVARILSIGAVASAYPFKTFAASALHWLTMTAWLAIFERTRFCHAENSSMTIAERITQILFCAILGLVYIFTYLTPSEGKTRNRYLVYYPLCFLENTGGIILWSLMVGSNIRDSWYYVPLIVSSIVPFLIGIIFMVIYYKYFHPQTAQKIHMPFCCTFQPNVNSPTSPQGSDPNYRFNYINDINAKLNPAQTPESL